MRIIYKNINFSKVSENDFDIIEKSDVSKNDFDIIEKGDIENKPLLAPNGRPSNLSRYHYELVRTDEFKSWFGDWESDKNGSSKVVDENGEPMIVYHGTDNIFDNFDVKKIKRREIGPGFYFTSIKDIAAGYSNTNRVISTFLNIKNPLDYKAKPFSLSTIKRFIMIASQKEASLYNIDIRDGFLSNYIDTYTNNINKCILEASKLIVNEDTALNQISGLVSSGVDIQVVNDSLLKSTGYDGYIARGSPRDGIVFVAIDNSQIRRF